VAERLASLAVRPELDVADARLHVELAEAYIAAHERVRRKESEIHGLRARHDDALRRLGGGQDSGARAAHEAVPASEPVREVELNASTLERVEHLLERRQAARAELHEFRRQLAELDRTAPAGWSAESPVSETAGSHQGGRTKDGL